MKNLAARLRRLEPKAPARADAPHVLEVRYGETIEGALARFRSQWPKVRRDHRFMVVPAIMTPAEFSICSEARRDDRRRALGTFNTAKDASL